MPGHGPRIARSLKAERERADMSPWPSGWGHWQGSPHWRWDERLDLRRACRGDTRARAARAGRDDGDLGHTAHGARGRPGAVAGRAHRRGGRDLLPELLD